MITSIVKRLSSLYDKIHACQKTPKGTAAQQSFRNKRCVEEKLMIKKSSLSYTILLLLISQSISAQCLEDRHTTSAIDGWLSCEIQANPNAIRGMSHWLHLNFGSIKVLHDLQIWNMNHPDMLESGMKTVIIDVSNNGSNWTTVDTFTFGRGNGSSYYKGFLGPDLGGISAQHILLTGVDNYGGGCFGLSELRIYTEDFEPDEMILDQIICERDGVFKNMQGGLNYNGTYSGSGVTDNGDDTFDFDSDLAGPGLHHIKYEYSGGSTTAILEVLPCSSAECSGCLDCATYDQGIVDSNPIPGGIYHSLKLKSSGTVGQEPVIFYGKHSVELNTDFTVNESTQFTAAIRQCYENFLSNPGFEMDLTSWAFQANSDAAAVIDFDDPSPYEGNQSARITVTGIGNTPSDVRMSYTHLSMEAGKTYLLSFRIKADQSRQLEARIAAQASPYITYLSHGINAEPFWQRVEINMVAPDDRLEDIKLMFYLGLEVGTYLIDQVVWAEHN